VKIGWSESSRAGAYELPAATLLVTAHRELETLCLDRETAHYSKFSRCAMRSWSIRLWFTEQHEALDAYFTQAQKRVTARWA